MRIVEHSLVATFQMQPIRLGAYERWTGDARQAVEITWTQAHPAVSHIRPVILVGFRSIATPAAQLPPSIRRFTSHLLHNPSHVMKQLHRLVSPDGLGEWLVQKETTWVRFRHKLVTSSVSTAPPVIAAEIVEAFAKHGVDFLTQQSNPVVALDTWTSSIRREHPCREANLYLCIALCLGGRRDACLAHLNRREATMRADAADSVGHLKDRDVEDVIIAREYFASALFQTDEVWAEAAGGWRDPLD